MKALLFTIEYPPFKGGVANYYGNLVKYWPGSSLSVLNNSDQSLLGAKGFWPKWLPACWRLYRQQKKEKFSWILVGQVLPLGLVAWIVRRFCNFRYAIFLHGMDLTFADRQWRKRLVAKLVFSGADKIICANHYTAELLRRRFGGPAYAKSSVVNPGISLEGLEDESKLPEETKKIRQKYNLEGKIILFGLGRLVRRKGFDFVLQALKEIPLSEQSKLVYVLAGEGEDHDYLRQLAEILELDNVIFLGAISDEEKYIWLETADIFIMTSREIKGDFEGFGIVYLEAGLMGKPIIAGTSGGVKDAVDEGLSGLLVNPENIGEIKEAIVKLAADKSLRESLGRHGRERAISEFNWSKQAKIIFNIFNTQ